IRVRTKKKRATQAESVGGRVRRAATNADRRFSDLVHGLGAICWEPDASTFQFSFVSDRAEGILGYPIARWLEEAEFFRAFGHPDDREHVEAMCRAGITKGEAFRFEFGAIAADGHVVWLRNGVRIVRDARGRPRPLRGLMIAITEVHQGDEARKQLIAIIEATTDFVGITDKQGRVLYINSTGRQLLGIGADQDLAAFNAADFQSPQTRTLLRDQGLPTAMRAGVWSGETDLLLPGGQSIPVSQVIVAHKTAHGGVDFFATIARDISDRKRAEEEKAALLDVARDISGAVEIDAILARVQRRTAAVLSCDSVLTFYWDPTREVFRMIAHYGLTAEAVADLEALVFPPGAPFDGRLEAGQTVVINDVATQTSLPPDLMARFRVTALTAAPLRVRGRNLGALVAFTSRDGCRFAPSQVELCEAIARQLALAFETTELYRAQQEEAQIAAALARVGHEMISSLDTPVILDRLCQLTTEVVGCDTSHTILWKPDENVYVPVSGYGDDPEFSESIKLLRVPPSAVAELMERLARGAVVKIPPPPDNTHPLAGLVTRYGLTASLYVALRRGDKIIGYHTARYRGRHERFTSRQRRILQGIAQLASMALENARLVEELERASGLKTDFVATMSHELRTPLNVIVGYNELLLDRVLGDVNQEQSDTLRRMDKRAHQLLELINARRDVSRLEAAQIQLNLREVCVPDLTAEIDTELRDLRLKPGVDFIWRVSSTLPAVRTDRVKLKVVLKNLINNALKFTDEGSVTVSVERRDGHIEFAVADTGIGIPQEAHAVIFEPFRQADSSMTRRHGGVGLGLYIVRRLLEMLGGSITIDSAVGRGSTFRVSLPTEEARSKV